MKTPRAFKYFVLINQDSQMLRFVGRGLFDNRMSKFSTTLINQKLQMSA